jgi:glycerol-3-phosphate dehydrogenase
MVIVMVHASEWCGILPEVRRYEFQNDTRMERWGAKQAGIDGLITMTGGTRTGFRSA